MGIDPVGDVALIQLLGRDDFPVAEIGDSDRVEAGDWVFAAGNPFLLADDFTPSISYGMLSGVHRYQFPAGTLLEYTDCLQTDAAINPGNSGGPLFDAAGPAHRHQRPRVVREARPRERRRRLRDLDQPGDAIRQPPQERPDRRSRVAGRHGVDAGRRPRGGRRHSGNERRLSPRAALRRRDRAVRRSRDRHGQRAQKHPGRVSRAAGACRWCIAARGRLYQTDVRLPGLHDEAELIALVQSEEAEPPQPDEGRRAPAGDEPRPDDEPTQPERPEAAAGLRRPAQAQAEAARGRRRALSSSAAATRTTGTTSKRRSACGAATWRRSADRRRRLRVAARRQARNRRRVRPGDVTDEQADIRLPWGTHRRHLRRRRVASNSARRAPAACCSRSTPGNGWSTRASQRFGEVYYLGQLPHGPDNVVEDCLVGLYEGMEVRFFFAATTGDLTGIELFSADDADPCEICFSQFAEVAGRRLPQRWWVRSGDAVFAELVVDAVGRSTPDDAPSPGTED